MKSKNILAQILGSQVRAELFRLLFDSDMARLHMREIERRSKLTIGTIQQDLKKLSTIDLLVSERDGNRLYYCANKNHPLFNDIQNLVTKTTGAALLLLKAFTSDKAIEKTISCAFIFGSIARNEEKAASDLDLMVIGTIGLRKLSHLLMDVTDKLGREINPHILSPADFKKKVAHQDHFITQVLNTKKVFIIGSEDELKTMVR